MDTFGKGLALGIAITVISGIVLFLFQHFWKSNAKLYVDVRPHPYFNFDGTPFQNVECSYEISIENVGDLPAKDIFIYIPDVTSYSHAMRYRPNRITNLNKIDKNIEINEIKQNEVVNLLVFSDRSCLSNYSSDDIVSGYKDGVSRTRYWVYLDIIPYFIVNNQLKLLLLVLIIFSVSVGIAATYIGSLIEGKIRTADREKISNAEDGTDDHKDDDEKKQKTISCYCGLSRLHAVVGRAV